MIMLQFFAYWLLSLTLNTNVSPTPKVQDYEKNNKFCYGWDQGYKAGYCYENTYCIAPTSPACPNARFQENTYKDGYELGFKKGLKDKKEKERNF